MLLQHSLNLCFVIFLVLQLNVAHSYSGLDVLCADNSC